MIEFQTDFEPKIAFCLDQTNEITFKVKKLDFKAFESLRGKVLNVTIKEFKPKKTKSQNAYMWELIHKIAEKTGLAYDDVYRNYIRDYGVYDIVGVQESAKARFIAEWNNKGLGWFTVELGGRNLQVFYGSSVYTKDEMRRVIEGIIYDCEAMDIPVMELADFDLLANENEVKNK